MKGPTNASFAPIRLTLYSDALYSGGAEVYLWLLAKHLDRSRFQLSAVLPADPGAAALGEKLHSLGVELFSLPRPGLRWARMLPRMVRIFRQVGGEVLHLNLPSCYDAGVSSVAWAARQAGYRWVVSTEHLPMIERRYRKFPAKLFFSHWIDRIIVIAEANRALLVRRHGLDAEKIRAIPNGVDDPLPLLPSERDRLRLAWGAEKGCVVVGIVGHLTRRKGHHRLLEALSLLPPHASASYRLVVVGEGEEEAALRRSAESLKLVDRVTWLGHRLDAAQLMAAFDLFVLPSSMETMPLTVLEAMAAGVPVIATSIYGLPEMVISGQSGLLVPPEDPRALALALERLLMEPPLRAEMGRQGRLRFEQRFTAARMAEATASLYLEGLEQRTPALVGAK